MDADSYFDECRGELMGKRITYIRLACNILLLYIECEPGDGRGMTFWLNPPWQVRTPARVVAGSLQAQGEGDEGPTTEELNQVSRPIWAALQERPILAIEVDGPSRELTIRVAGDHCIRTFVADPQDDHSWHLRDNATKLGVLATPSGLRSWQKGE